MMNDNIQYCRLCAGPIDESRSVVMEGMPKSAQYLPGAADLSKDFGIDLVITECPFCGVFQAANPPVPYFREVIRSAGISMEMQGYRRKQFKDFILRYNLTGKRLLEVGCGSGEYLEILNECGVLGSGIEYGQSAYQAALEKGLTVSRQFFETGNELVEGAPFDGFLFLNFLEHLPDPRSVFAGIRQNISESGIGLVEVPNFELILRDQMYSEFISDHLLYFSRDSLRKILETNGFVVLECDETWYSYTLTAVVKKYEPTRTFEIKEYGERLFGAFDKFLGSYGERQVAIWGAGHQAFTIMALANLGGKIRYVVDSAPFKQGKYTPATHLEIVPPERFFSDQLPAIIVLGGSYTDEIVSTIRRQATFEVDIGIVDGSSISSLKTNPNM